MNIDNIALVRITDILPKNGVVEPSSKGQFLIKANGTEFSYAIADMIRKYENYGFTEEEMKRFISDCNKLTPYTSEYVSTTCYSVNSVVPEDINMSFDNRPYVIIEPLKEQINKADIVSIRPYEVIVEGPMMLSENAVIIADKNKITEDDLNNLKNRYTVILCDGNVREACNDYLKASNRFTCEQLNAHGFIESNTSDQIETVLEEVAQSKNIEQVKHINSEVLKSDIEKTTIIEDFYEDMFLKYLCENTYVKNDIKEYFIEGQFNKDKAELLKQIVTSIGLKTYVDLVVAYNNQLENMIKNGQLLTNEQIINNYFQTQEFNNDYTSTK
jgi:hypothetical protein